MAIKRFKIRGHIEGYINEIIGGERFCYLMIDTDTGGDLIIANQKTIPINMDNPETVGDEHKQNDYAGWEAQLPKAGVVTPKPIVEEP